MTRCPECDAEIDLDEDEVEEGENCTRAAPSAMPNSK